MRAKPALVACGACFLVFLAVWAAEANAADASPAERSRNRPVSAQELMRNLAPHPRIVLTEERLEQLRNKISDVEWAAELEGELHQLADEFAAGRRTQAWRPKGWELASTGVVSRISALALAYRLHGDPKHLREAERSLRQIAQEAVKPNVGVEYLKRSAVLVALGIGYDWLHDDLSKETLDLIERGILDGGARDLVQNNKYRIPSNNWTTVCYGGTAVATLAIAERHPELAADAASKAIELLPTITSQYKPDGISFEGPHYWDLPSMYHALLADSLQTALGSDYGLAAAPGLRESFTWRLVARGPSGDDFAFGDGERVNRAVQAFAWAAREYGLNYLVSRADLQRMMRQPERLREKTWMVFPLVWLPAGAVDGTPPVQLLAFRGGGPSANVIFRSAWNDPNALWLAIKGGRAHVSHGHMDVGSFILELDGVRWFEELTTHHYYAKPFHDHGITGIWDYGRQSKRWRVYAWNNRGHNTLTAGDDLHEPDAMGNVVAFNGTPGQYAATISLGKVLGRKVTEASRTFRVPDGKTVLVEDVWTAADQPFTMTARFHTFARVEKRSDRRVTLTRDGKCLTLEILGPGHAELAVNPAEVHMQPWDRKLDGLTAIDIHVPTRAEQTQKLSCRIQTE